MNRRKKLIITITAIASVWAALVCGSLAWNLYNEKNQQIEQARRSAQVALNKDTAFRQWVRSHGGVYVPVDAQTPPNDWLSHVPNRDITIADRLYTLMNSSYATRQMMEAAGDQIGILSRVTSLKPMRPQNAPDAWEAGVLKAFSKNKQREDFFEVTKAGQLRGLRPFYVEQSCLKCHIHQGYEVGDLRGGISVRIELARFFEKTPSIAGPLWWTHGFFGLLGFFAIGWIYKGAARNLRNEAFLAGMNRNLEERVIEEINRRREQEQMLIQQSKMASMGEMIGAIAHQWRQPLNTLSITVQDISDAFNHGELDKPYIEKNVDRAVRQIEYMAQTIDDFRNFFRPDTDHHAFDLGRAVNDVISLLSSQLKSHRISLHTDLPADPLSVRGLSNHFKQALLNILANAQDAIVQANLPAGEIKITLRRRAN